MLKLSATHEVVASGADAPMYSGTPLVWHDGALWGVYRLVTDGYTYLQCLADGAASEPIRVSHEPCRPGESDVHLAPAVGVVDGEITVAYMGADHGYLAVGAPDPIPLDADIAFDFAWDGPFLYAAGRLVSENSFDLVRFDRYGNGRTVINARPLPYGYEQIEARARAGRLVWLCDNSPNQIHNGPLCAAEVDARGRLRPLDASRVWTYGPLDAQAEAYRIFAGDIDQGTECSWDLTSDGQLAILLKVPISGHIELGRMNAKSPGYACAAQLMVGGELQPPYADPWPGNWAFQHPILWQAPRGLYVILGNGDLHYRSALAGPWTFGVVNGGIDSTVDYRLADGRLALTVWTRTTGQIRVLVLEEVV